MPLLAVTDDGEVVRWRWWIMDAHSRETSKTERTRGRTHQRGNRGASRPRTPLVTVVAGGAAWGVLVGIVLGAWGGGTTKPQAQYHCVLLLRPHPPSTTPVYVGRPGTCLELQDGSFVVASKTTTAWRGPRSSNKH